MLPLLPQIQTNIFIYLSLVLCAVAAITILMFVVPLQVKQAGVKNGLAMLRKQLLAYGLITFLTTSIASYFLAIISYRLLTNPGTYVSTVSQILLFLFSLSKFAIAFIGSQIYHQQYVLEHKPEWKPLSYWTRF